jgi:hypothetical protein
MGLKKYLLTYIIIEIIFNRVKTISNMIFMIKTLEIF